MGCLEPEEFFSQLEVVSLFLLVPAKEIKGLEIWTTHLIRSRNVISGTLLEMYPSCLSLSERKSFLGWGAGGGCGGRFGRPGSTLGPGTVELANLGARNLANSRRSSIPPDLIL